LTRSFVSTSISLCHYYCFNSNHQSIGNADIGGIEFNFSDGRAVRELSAPQPSSTWKPKQWSIVPEQCNESATVYDMDPRVWTDSPLVLYIRELADPSDEKSNRFLELYSPNKRNYIIQCNKRPYIIRGEEGKGDANPSAAPSFQPSAEPSFQLSGQPTLPYLNYHLVISGDNNGENNNIIALAGRTIDKNGYVVFCKEKSDRFGVDGSWHGRCGEVLSTDLEPTDSVAIVIGNYPANYETVDIYGQFALEPHDDSQNFENGTAVRKATASCPMPEFNQDDWVVKANVTSDMLNPAGSGCRLIITELASPVDNTDARYVELFSDNCPGKTIGDNFKLVVIVAGSDIIPEEGIDLEGMMIGTDGFLVLCSTAKANVAYGGKCDLIVGKDTAVDNDGYNSIAIVLIGESDGPIIYDIYGEHLSRF